MQVFDIHAHIYPPAIAPKAVAAIRSVYEGVEIPGDGLADSLVPAMDRAGVACCAVHSVATRARQVDAINDFILSSARRRPGRFVPFAAMHPDCPDPEASADALRQRGFAGVKLHPELQGFPADSPQALRLFRALAGRLPVLLHCGHPTMDLSSPRRVLAVLDRVPGLTLICAHMGGWTHWQEAAAALKGADIWIDTSSSLYALSPEAAADLLRGFGTDRALFGTDFPSALPGQELERFLRLPLTPEERRAILWDNAKALLGDKIGAKT